MGGGGFHARRTGGCRKLLARPRELPARLLQRVDAHKLQARVVKHEDLRVFVVGRSQPHARAHAAVGRERVGHLLRDQANVQLVRVEAGEARLVPEDLVRVGVGVGVAGVGVWVRGRVRVGVGVE